MKTPMNTLEAELTAAGSNAYWGEKHDWFIGLGQNRDSDGLTRSNFRSMLRRLGGESSYVAIERMNHWACGWVEYLLIKPTARQSVRKANEMRAAMEDYPVLDESDWSELESTEFYEFARGELKEWEWWDSAMYELERNGNYDLSEDSSGQWQLIEDTKEMLESMSLFSRIDDRI